MKCNLIKYIVATGAVLGVAVSLQATPITGGISLSGGYAVNTGSLKTATAFSSFNTVVVATGATDSYLGTDGSSVTMIPFTFNPVTLPVNKLWDFTYSGSEYYFDLTSLSVDFHGSKALLLSGAGILHIDGFTDTAGDWTFTANSLGGTFSFSSSNGALLVPDGGMTVMLLGAALSGLALIRRKLA